MSGRSAPCIRAFLSGLLVLAFSLSAVSVRAVVEGSPHDLVSQGYDVVKPTVSRENCNLCHLPTPAQKGFLPEVPAVLEHSFGAASLVCFSCHDGTTIVSPDVDASRTAFHPASHGNDLAGYEELRSETVGLPYLSGQHMECVTCHDPHDNSHRPFLRADLQELCFSCHSRYAEFGRGLENHTGNHLLAADPAVSTRPEAPLRIAEAFRTAFPSPYPLLQGKGSGGWHWQLGGHLAKGGSGGIACSSCHLVHGNGSAPPPPALLTIEPQNDLANRFCEGCHAGERGDGELSTALPNPGGTKTGRTYHPADDDTANGPGRIVEVEIPKGWPVGAGDPPRLLCTTCHIAHGAKVATSLLRPFDVSVGYCEGCHTPVLPANHHPLKSSGNCSKALAPSGTLEAPGMSCYRCHRAHNAGLGKPDEKRYLPLLRGIAEETCLTCHPADNPTCSTRPEFRASHFLGDPLEAYQDQAPPLRRDPWPESGLSSYYGNPENRVVTCLSCHSFQSTLPASGDTNTSHSLLARSGNSVEWTEDDEASYLCTGCHTASPATGEGEDTKGHTHPMMEASVKKLDREILPPVTSTPEGRLNCDTCHRPHEAMNRGGYYILEIVDGPNTDPQAIHPKIDFTILCQRCHDK